MAELALVRIDARMIHGQVVRNGLSVSAVPASSWSMTNFPLTRS